ncbi:MAG: type II toxin-antitoxin system Phd/YefM family antitoxin [Chloroflexota bacterium]
MPSDPPAPAKPVLPEKTIGVRELKNNLTRIVNIVRNEQKEYIITVHGRPVAVLRPYMEEDIQASDQAFEQEMAEMLETAKRVGDASRKKWNGRC